MSDFKTLLMGLRDGLIDQNNTKSNVVGVKDFYETHTIQLADDQKTLLQDIFTKLTDKAVSAADGGNIYQHTFHLAVKSCGRCRMIIQGIRIGRL